MVSRGDVDVAALGHPYGPNEERGVFRSIFDLQASINRFLKEHNTQSKPFVWTADPKRVLAAVKRGKQTLESVH